MCSVHTGRCSLGQAVTLETITLPAPALQLSGIWEQRKAKPYSLVPFLQQRPCSGEAWKTKATHSDPSCEIYQLLPINSLETTCARSCSTIFVLASFTSCRKKGACFSAEGIHTSVLEQCSLRCCANLAPSADQERAILEKTPQPVISIVTLQKQRTSVSLYPCSIHTTRKTWHAQRGLVSTRCTGKKF